MLVQRDRTPGRAAFTLIELLVVIAIIGVLISLTAAGVMKFLGKGPEVQCRFEVGQLEIAITNFKDEFKVEYIPSNFQLRNDYTVAPATTDDLSMRSLAYLQKMFGRRFTGKTTGFGDAKLNGSQCLVFFLGGQFTESGGAYAFNGFSTDPINPFAAGGTRKGPYYDGFKGTRLNVAAGTNPQYLDPWGTPYVYLTAINRAYDLNLAGTTVPLNKTNMNVWAYCEGDSTTFPYPPMWLKPHTHQLISAGPNKMFGTTNTATANHFGCPPNSVTTPITSAATAPKPWSKTTLNSDGNDDITNFVDRTLGAGR